MKGGRGQARGGTGVENPWERCYRGHALGKGRKLHSRFSLSWLGLLKRGKNWDRGKSQWGLGVNVGLRGESSIKGVKDKPGGYRKIISWGQKEIPQNQRKMNRGQRPPNSKVLRTLHCGFYPWARKK